MKRIFYFSLVLIIFFGVMVSSIIQRQYYKSLCEEEKKLEKKLMALVDERNKLICEIEKLTTLERLVGTDASRYRVSFNKVIIIREKN